MSWFKTRAQDSQVDIECPHCKQEQRVSDNISAVFCKSCKKTIFVKKAIKKSQETKQAPKKEEAPKKEDKPSSKKEEVKEEVPSSIKPSTQMPSSHPTTPTTAINKPGSFPTATMSTSTKTITCSNCHTSQEVPSIALASFCEKCGQRINLQDYKIKGHFHGELETRGEIRIATGADVNANLNVGSAVIEGKIKGEIVAEYKVELNEGCLVSGTIESPVLKVNEGAGFVGKAIINPPKEK